VLTGSPRAPSCYHDDRECMSPTAIVLPGSRSTPKSSPSSPFRFPDKKRSITSTPVSTGNSGCCCRHSKGSGSGSGCCHHGNSNSNTSTTSYRPGFFGCREPYILRPRSACSDSYSYARSPSPRESCYMGHVRLNGSWPAGLVLSTTKTNTISPCIGLNFRQFGGQCHQNHESSHCSFSDSCSSSSSNKKNIFLQLSGKDSDICSVLCKGENSPTGSYVKLRTSQSHSRYRKCNSDSLTLDSPPIFEFSLPGIILTLSIFFILVLLNAQYINRG
jgi:hypothetical protein